MTALEFIRSTDSFDTENVAAMRRLFDEAWQSLVKSGLQFSGREPAAKAILASCIVDMAQRGMVDQRKLRDEVLRRLLKDGITAPYFQFGSA
jgi:hypothetical protein